jgi:DNA-binding phage protein
LDSPQLGFALLTGPTRPELPLARLSDEEQAVALALRWGRANARKVREIAAEAGLGSRRAQEIVQRLLHDHGWPIGTAMEAPHGNYLIDNPEELQSTVLLLRARGISNLARAAALQRMTLRRFLAAVQQDLLLGDQTS